MTIWYLLPLSFAVGGVICVALPARGPGLAIAICAAALLARGTALVHDHLGDRRRAS